MKRTASLRWRVLAVLSLAALLPTVIVGALAIMRARNDVEREVDRGALAHVAALGAAVDATLQHARRTIELAAGSWADAPSDERATELLLHRLRDAVPVHALSILDPSGQRLFGDPVTVNLDAGSHSFGGYVGDVVYADGRAVVHVVVQARNRTGELAGVMVAGLDLGFVRGLLRGAVLGRGARLVVVDGAGVVVATSDEPGAEPAAARPASLLGRDPAVDRALSSTAGTLSAGGWVSAYRNLSSYQSQRGVRWAILYQQPVDQAYALARETTRDALIIGGAALAFALALGAYFATRLTRPLAALARHADAIAAGATGDPPPVPGPGEIGVLGQRIDEMARRIAERAALQSALANGDRLASVGVMAARVAHEINNPLTTVLGYAMLLQESKAADDPERASLEMIANGAERMRSIVRGLLEYTRAPRKADGPAGAKTPPPAASCDPAVVLRHAGALLEPQMRRTKAVLAIDATATAPLAIEASALQQVLVNLAQNAAQAMAAAGIEGGTIAIAARPAPGSVSTLITVTDEGPGIPAADRDHVFDPFFKTKSAEPGTGLGLAVCKHLVTTAGGTIEVGDGPNGRGAEFRIVIPNAK